MRSKRVQNRFKKALPTIQAACAFASVIVEATRRGLGRDSGPEAAEGALEQASGDVFVILGRNLRQRSPSERRWRTSTAPISTAPR